MIRHSRRSVARMLAGVLGLGLLAAGPRLADAQAAAASAASAQAATVAGPPLFAPGTVEETFHGVRVADPYRALENTKAPAVAAWMKAQSEHAHATLQRVAGRQRLLEAVRKYDEAASARVFEPVRLPSGLWFYQKRGASENQFKLYMRRGDQGEEVLLVDPDALQKRTGKPHAINYFAPSPDGRHVAYGISAGGSEAAVLHVLDTTTRKVLGAPVDRADFASAGWAHDGLSLVFNRLQPLKAGGPATQKYQNSRVYRMVPGRPPSGAVFGRGVAGVDLKPEEIPVVQFTHDGRWAIGTVYNGVQRELALYVAPASSLDRGRPRWTRVVDAADAVTQFDYFDGHLYLVSHKGAPRSQVLRLKVDGRMADAQVWVPHSNRVVIAVGAAADALYVEARDGNVKRLLKLGHRVAPGTPATEVRLPVDGAFGLAGGESTWRATEPRLPGVVLDLAGWTRARQIYEVGADGGVRNTGLQPQGPYDAPEHIVATEVQVKSHDGAMVPMSIIHRRGLRTDGSHPTILYGYASYGITEEPFFSTSRLAWLEAGGVFAVANPRGSGVYGQDWYKAGFQATKPNTWRDFIACAEWLIAQGYTNNARLGIWGGSAGGILVGRAMTERPDLFAAVVSAVGALDGLRFEDTANGVPNIPEFGSRKTEAGLRSLMVMSTYHNIQPGTAYPAVMFTHGVNDPRVEVWQSTKTAARLMAATRSNKPVLLLLDYQSGHGIGNTKQQVHEERANVFAFFMWQFGMPGFELR